mmetsp:Transcript_25509/g.59819  ORF Transcript_25509/g.59819 Transcript_25509/m.59819 type:complete len:324 (+) Transcript_25509:2738-3709(+)
MSRAEEQGLPSDLQPHKAQTSAVHGLHELSVLSPLLQVQVANQLVLQFLLVFLLQMMLGNRRILVAVQDCHLHHAISTLLDFHSASGWSVCVVSKLGQRCLPELTFQHAVCNLPLQLWSGEFFLPEDANARPFLAWTQELRAFIAGTSHVLVELFLFDLEPVHVILLEGHKIRRRFRDPVQNLWHPSIPCPVDVFLCDLVVDPSPQILVFKLFLQNAQAGQVLLQGYFIFYFLRLKAEIPALQVFQIWLAPKCTKLLRDVVGIFNQVFHLVPGLVLLIHLRFQVSPLLPCVALLVNFFQQLVRWIFHCPWDEIGDKVIQQQIP